MIFCLCARKIAGKSRFRDSAIHRTTANQICTMHLEKGRHTHTMRLGRISEDMVAPQLVFGIGIMKNFWQDGAFRTVAK